jgi:hypothetical protein
MEPRFFTAWVTSNQACHTITPPCTHIIVRNRGDDLEPPTGDIELALTTPDSTDTFLLKVDEREHFGPSKFTEICYKRTSDGHKVRLDFLFF